MNSSPPFARPAFNLPFLRPSSRPPLSPFPQAQSLPDCFYESFCAANGLGHGEFEREMLKRCLFPHARLLRPVIEAVAPGFFCADIDFLRGVGVLRHRREFAYEADDFMAGLSRSPFLRRVLRLRVSVARVRSQLDACWGAP